MSISQDSNLTINQQGYAAFDALSLKQLIIDRLNAGSLYTDQNFEGSNISAIIDIIAYSYHVLLFYLNRTASESLFNQATLYENVNKIVKELNYKPIGYQTSILSFKSQANQTLEPDTYTIQRYSYFTLNGINYSFNSDVSFTKTTTEIEELNEFSENNLLYQGVYVEYPPYFAIGDEFETINITYISDNDNEVIDHFNIDVYVKEKSSNKWYKYEESPSLFIEGSNARKFEKRLNENEKYEIKFGNNITGRKLDQGDEVAIYFLKSDGTPGEVDIGLLNGNGLFLYKTTKYNQILADTVSSNLRYLTEAEAKKLTFINIDPSTQYQTRESVAAIKNNAPKIYNSQYRLVTGEDIETFVNRNFANIISSTKAVNNWDYVNGHLRYFIDLDLKKPNTDSRILFNQTKFADTCDFNNIYVYAVPRLEKITSLTKRTNYLNTAQKDLLLNELQKYKLLTSEIIVTDPVYVAVDLGIRRPGEILTTDVATQSKLVITKNVLSQIDSQSIKNQVYNLFKSYFDSQNNSLGKLIDLNELTKEIYNITGVEDFYVERTDSQGTFSVPGINFLVWNPVYPEGDINIVSQNYQLPYFKYPFLNNPLDFIDKIEILTVSNVNTKIEY
jgi:hypothetical protein